MIPGGMHPQTATTTPASAQRDIHWTPSKYCETQISTPEPHLKRFALQIKGHPVAYSTARKNNVIKAFVKTSLHTFTTRR
jgi:hypothetical protein